MPPCLEVSFWWQFCVQKWHQKTFSHEKRWTTDSMFWNTTQIWSRSIGRVGETLWTWLANWYKCRHQRRSSNNQQLFAISDKSTTKLKKVDLLQSFCLSFHESFVLIEHTNWLIRCTMALRFTISFDRQSSVLVWFCLLFYPFGANTLDPLWRHQTLLSPTPARQAVV